MDQILAVDGRDLGAFIPSELDDYGLDPYEFRLYCRICRRAGSGVCFESYTKMAEGCGMDLKTLRSKLDNLERWGLIRRTPRPGKSDLIQLTPSREWMPRTEENQPKPPKITPAKSTPTKNGGGTKNGRGALPKTEGVPLPKTEGVPLPKTEDEGSPSKDLPLKDLSLRFSPETRERDEENLIEEGMPIAPYREWLVRQARMLPKPPGQLEVWIYSVCQKQAWQSAYREAVASSVDQPSAAAPIEVHDMGRFIAPPERTPEEIAAVKEGLARMKQAMTA